MSIPKKLSNVKNEELSQSAPVEDVVAMDPFDPKALRLGANTAAGAIGVKKQVLNVRVGKPNKQEFCRIHPDESYRLDTAILIDSAFKESYLVAPPLWKEIPDFITLVRLCTAITRHGTLFLWQATLPAPDGRPCDWHDSMLQAQELAIKGWVRVQSDMQAGSYGVFNVHSVGSSLLETALRSEGTDPTESWR